ncbi:MAG: hypothetical protein HY659_08640 [Rhizobiales bacterium]|nr:hypothetical protein [Hyphomicrobiales bacterium]
MIKTRTMLSAIILLAGLTVVIIMLGQALAQSEQKVLASAEFSNDPNLRCDLLEVKRVSGGALNIRWRIVNTVGQAGGLTGTPGKPISYGFSWNEFYYIDPAENKKYSYLTDSGGNRILQVFEGQYVAGQQRVNWAKFPAPPATSKKISVYIAKFPPFEDIPVSE